MIVRHFGIPARSGRYPYEIKDNNEPRRNDWHPTVTPQTHPKEPEYSRSLNLDELKRRAEELNAQFDDIGESVTDELWTMSGINDWVSNVFELINQINALEEVEN